MDDKKDPIAKAKELATALPPEKLARLLAELPAAGGPDEDRVAPIRTVLVDRLNTLRPQRARRLFTSLLHSHLADDPEFVEPPLRAPLLFRRTDIGAIWATLARTIFPEKVAEATQLLERLCVDRLVDEAIELPEARDMREELRLLTITRLGQILREHHHAEAFCTLANGLRDRLNADRTRFMTPIGPGQLADLIAILSAWPVLAPATAAILRATPPHADPQEAGTALVEATIALRHALATAGLPADSAEALPIALLNRREVYDVLATYIAERNAGNTPRVAEALVARLGETLHGFAFWLSRLIPETRKEEAPIVIDDDNRDHLGNLMNRTDEMIAACRHAGLFDAATVQPMLLGLANDLMNHLVHGPLARSGRRFAAAVVSRANYTSDIHDVRHVVGLLIRLRHVLRPTGLPIQALNRWRDQLVADIEYAVHRATRLEDAEESPLERFQHLERIERLAEIIGSTISPILQPTSRHTQVIFAARLAEPGPLSETARRLCANYAAVIRDEIAKVRYWRNPDMVEFADLAASRGF
ncbi:MAG: hypothetical protein PHS60_06025 [Zavarzinia sp.]|nr:hypothetical protein [Zavarzinia sp.]